MKIISLVMTVLLLSACASTKLKPEAAAVQVSENPPAANCKKVGEVEAFTSVNVANRSENLLVNLMKNDAHSLGGNYVVLTEATALKHVGTVYNCP